MKRSEAYELAIESMCFRRVACEPLRNDWLKYGEKLAFRRDEARRTAELYDCLTAAIELLRALRSRSEEADQ